MERFMDYFEVVPVLTKLLLGAMVLLHLGASFWELTHRKVVWFWAFLGSHSNPTLIEFGARAQGRVAQGELWRLVTCGFVHGDLIHLVVNGMALVGLGRLGEAVFGPARFIWIFTLAVIGGALAAQAHGGSISFGASGGLFGVMGALLSFGWLRREFLPAQMLEVFGKQLALWTALNLIIGFFLPFVSSPSHVGGLIAGLLAGLLHEDRLTNDQAPNETTIVLTVAGILGISFGILILQR
jgi:rhomboid protease GluP